MGLWMFRGQDSEGQWQGGPMYVVREGLGKKWLPLAYFFAVAGLLGTMPIFQINQLVQVLRDTLAIPAGLASADAHFTFDLMLGLVLALLVMAVALGKLPRLGKVTGMLVPTMVVGYLLLTAVVLASHASEIPAAFAMIFEDAISGNAVAGGVVGAVIITGIRRAAFSNEAGIGTEAMAHGAAQTKEPVREGMVAMLGPVIDTLIVCTCTALVILISGVWQSGESDGVTLTANAFGDLFPHGGAVILAVLVSLLSLSTVFYLLVLRQQVPGLFDWGEIPAPLHMVVSGAGGVGCRGITEAGGEPDRFHVRADGDSHHDLCPAAGAEGQSSGQAISQAVASISVNCSKSARCQSVSSG